MVAPVTPRTPKNYDTPTAFRTQLISYKQASPITVPLEYSSQAGIEENMSGDRAFLTSLGSTMFGDGFPGLSVHVAAAQLQAYERLKGSVNEQAQLGAAIAECEQSLKMIIARGGQLVSLIRAVRKLDFVTAGSIIRKATIPKGVSVKKSFANNWLEYSFGWRPLIQDVYSACEVLSSPIKSIRPRATGSSGPLDWRQTSGSIASGFYSEDARNFVIKAVTGCEVTVNNPNLFLLNNLGLANPGTVLWEVIPFSFVVDWFFTVNSFLSSGTDWLGLGMNSAYNTYTVYCGLYEDRRNPFWSSPVNTRTSFQVRTWRVPALYNPVITIRPMKLPSWGRAANMISVATQLLSGR